MRIGAKVDEPTNVFADNKIVLCNARAMASTLKKKQYALAYHKRFEFVRMILHHVFLEKED